MRVLGTHVYMIEQMLLHEIAVALLVLRIKTAIFVQIEGGHARKIELAFLETAHELSIQTLGRRTGGQTQHATGLFRNQIGDDIGRSLAHFLIILGNVDFHGSPFILEA